jgi:hypothetical protein
MTTYRRRQKRRRRGGADLRRRPVLYPARILRWADAFHGRTGRWPHRDSGPVAGSPGDTWARVEKALRDGLRGLPGGDSLARLLARHRGVRNRKALPPYTEAQVLAWADRHFERTGAWPTRPAGAIPEAPGETWHAVDVALSLGRRGLPGGSSLAQLLARRRGVRNPARLPRLSRRQILAWADAHKAPEARSGPTSTRPCATAAAACPAGSRGIDARVGMPRPAVQGPRQCVGVGWHGPGPGALPTQGSDPLPARVALRGTQEAAAMVERWRSIVLGTLKALRGLRRYPPR